MWDIDFRVLSLEDPHALGLNIFLASFITSVLEDLTIASPELPLHGVTSLISRSRCLVKGLFLESYEFESHANNSNGVEIFLESLPPSWHRFSIVISKALSKSANLRSSIHDRRFRGWLRGILTAAYSGTQENFIQALPLPGVYLESSALFSRRLAFPVSYHLPHQQIQNGLPTTLNLLIQSDFILPSRVWNWKYRRSVWTWLWISRESQRIFLKYILNFLLVQFRCLLLVDAHIIGCDLDSRSFVHLTQSAFVHFENSRNMVRVNKALTLGPRNLVWRWC